MNNILGIDIGGTYTRYGVVSNNTVTNLTKIKTKDIEDFTNFISDLALRIGEIDTISIGIPGIVNNNKIISIPNVPVLRSPNLADDISCKTNIDVVLNKDVNLLFMHDIDQLHLTNTKNVLGFYLGTGLGNACKLNGKLLTGTNGFSGELGHIPIIGNTNICGCGKVGCAETIVSGRALQTLFQTLELKGEFGLLFENYKGEDFIYNFISNFAYIVAGEINIFDTLDIIIGGGVPNMIGFPKDLFEGILKDHLRSSSLVNELHVNYVNDDPINGIIGASLIIKE